MVNEEKKRIKESYEQVSIQIDTKKLKRIDATAKKFNMSRSELLRNLINVAYDDMILLDSLGLLTVGHIGRKIVSKLKIGLSTGKYTINEEGEIKETKKE